MTSYSESISLTCPNCDEDLETYSYDEMMIAIDEETEEAYLICPICCVQNKARLFEPIYREDD